MGSRPVFKCLTMSVKQVNSDHSILLSSMDMTAMRAEIQLFFRILPELWHRAVYFTCSECSMFSYSVLKHLQEQSQKSHIKHHEIQFHMVLILVLVSSFPLENCRPSRGEHRCRAERTAQVRADSQLPSDGLYSQGYPQPFTTPTDQRFLTSREWFWALAQFPLLSTVWTERKNAVFLH